MQKNIFHFILIILLSSQLLISCKSTSKIIYHSTTSVNLMDYTGKWAGILEIYSYGKLIDTVPMGLQIQSNQRKLNWELHYKGQEVRKYSMIKDSIHSERFLLDENNGIVLDGILNKNTLSFYFEVNETFLDCKYTFEKNQIRFNIYSGSLIPKRTSSDSGYVVRSLNIPHFQHCILKPI
ncbi:MAG: hypothetical protein IT267_08645 [Saprospiraceae bacterium]|nr:hypothetical protein [Saprospiraceae bacterium]